MSSAQYRLLAAGGSELEAGNGDVTVAGGVLELQPAGGTALRVPSGRIASVLEPEPFIVLVTLADGTRNAVPPAGWSSRTLPATVTSPLPAASSVPPAASSRYWAELTVS